jgi:hypothetical protein
MGEAKHLPLMYYMLFAKPPSTYPNYVAVSLLDLVAWLNYVIDGEIGKHVRINWHFINIT